MMSYSRRAHDGIWISLNHRTKLKFGEIDPEYMYFPECAERIKLFFDAPQLIFILGEPLSRAYSHYLMSMRRGYEILSFPDALLAEKKRMRNGDRFSQIHHSYMERGMYATQIERMLNVFPKSDD